MKYTIKIKQLEDGFLQVKVKGYGMTFAKNIKDVGNAVDEMIRCHNIAETIYGSNNI